MNHFFCLRPSSFILLVFWCFCVCHEASALTGAQVAVSRSTEPYFILDSNTPCGAGPRAAYVGIQIRNISGSKLNRVTIKINNVTPTSKYKYLGNGTDSTRWIGRLNAGDTGTAFFYMKYQCALDNDTCYISFTVSDSASGTVTFNTKVYTRNSISANAGGQLITHSFSTAKNLGVLVTDTVVYSYGNIQNGTEVNFQPNGDTLFNPSSLILINSQILSSQINSINVGTRNKTYFMATANTNGSSNQVKVVYYYLNKLQPGDSTIVHPYAGMTSGNTNYKYTGNYSDPLFSKYLVSTSGNISMTKSISSYYGHTGDTVTYTLKIINNGSAAIVFDEITDTLHTGYSFVSLDAASTINNSNSTIVPAAGDIGALTFRGGITAADFPYVTYNLNPGDSLKLIFKVKLPSLSYGIDTNAADVKIGSASVSRDTAINEILLYASGYLYDDRNGLVDGIVNGTLLDSSFHHTVYAYLASNTSGKITEVSTVSVGGSFQFSAAQKDSSYILMLSTQSLSKGATNPSTATLPSEWIATGENFGLNNSAGTAVESGTPNSRISVQFSSLDITALKFGWEKLPISFSNTAASQLNPGGTNKVLSAGMAGYDLEDDSISSGKKFVIYSLSSNAHFYYYDTLLKSNDTIRGYNRMKLTVDPLFSGQGNASFTFAAIDSANKASTASATITIPFTGLSISGTLYHDANGLSDGSINGTPIDDPGSTVLYSYLTQSGGVIIAKDTLDSGNGTFVFNQIADANTSYQLSISSQQLAVGSSGPASSGLPSGYVEVGDSYGSNNTSGSGNESGTPDLKIPLITGSNSITGVKFGIERKSTAHNKTYSGISPLYFGQASGNASYPYKITLNNASGTSNGDFSSSSASVMPGKVSGSDPEDGSYAGASGSAGVKTLILNTLPDVSNDVLVYNGIILTPGDTTNQYWNPTFNRYEIANFDPDSLELFLIKNGHKSFDFSYSWRDAAGVEGTSASYSVESYRPLPVSLLDFNADITAGLVFLNWKTAQEINSDYFDIERSVNGSDYVTIQRRPAMGNSQMVNYYQAVDSNINLMRHPNNIYYRLKMNDINGEYRYSEVRKLENPLTSNSLSCQIWPNPFIDRIHVNLNGISNEAVILKIYDLQGRLVKSADFMTSEGPTSLNMVLEDLNPGNYLIYIMTANFTQKVNILKQ